MRTSIFISLLLLSIQLSKPHTYSKEASVSKLAGDPSMEQLRADDPRPLDQIVLMLNGNFGWLLDYEDPPYRSKQELTGSVTQAWLARGGKEYYVPNGSRFEMLVSGPELAAASPNAYAFVTRLARVYNSSNNPGRFEALEESPERFTLAGKAIADEMGAYTPIQPLLDCSIIVTPTLQDTLTALNALIAQLALHCGATVQLGTVPFTLLQRVKYKPDGAIKPARQELTHLLDATKTGLAWSLLYDVNNNFYALNIATVGYYEPGSGDTVHFVNRSLR